MRRTTALLSTLVTSLVMLVAFPSASHAGWTTLSSPLTDSYVDNAPKVDSSGTTYVKVGSNGFAVRAAGGAFSTRTAPGSSIVDFGLSSVKSSWLVTLPDSKLGVTRRTAGVDGAFDTPFDLGAGKNGRLDVAPDGFEVMAWYSPVAYGSTSAPLVIAERDGTATTPTLVPLPTNPTLTISIFYSVVHVVVGADHSAAVIYRSPGGTVDVIERDPAGAWSAPRSVSATALYGLSDLQVAANDQGDAVMVWSDRGQNQSRAAFHASLRPVGGTFGPPELVMWGDSVPYGTGLAVASDGMPLVGIHEGRESGVTAIHRRVGGAWIEERHLGIVDVVAGRANARLALVKTITEPSNWYGEVDDERHHYVMTGTTAGWDAAGFVKLPEPAPPYSAFVADVGLFDDTRAIALYSGFENTLTTQHNYGAVLDDCVADCTSVQPRKGGPASVPPRIESLSHESETGTDEHGVDIVFRVTAKDIDGQTPLRYEWQVGFDPYVPGTAKYTHMFDKPGDQFVTVRVTDAAGASTTRSEYVDVQRNPDPPPPKPSGVIVSTVNGFFSVRSTLERGMTVVVTATKDPRARRSVLTIRTPVGRPKLWYAATRGARCIEGSDVHTLECSQPLSAQPAVWLRVLGTEHNDNVTVRGPLELEGDIASEEGADVIDMSRMPRQLSVDAGPGNDLIYACGCAPRSKAKQSGPANLEGGEDLDSVIFRRSPVGVARSWRQHSFIGSGVEKVIGTRFADWLVTSGAVHVDAGAGNDDVTGSEARMTVRLGAGSDTFHDGELVGAGTHVIGGPGTDTYAGAARGGDYSICLDSRKTACPAFDGREDDQDIVGPDVENVDLRASGGKDTIVGSPFANKLWGGPGDDVLIGGAGRDQIVGGAGIDAASWEPKALHSRAVRLSADGLRNDGTRGEDHVDTSTEVLVGSMFGDTILGGARNDGLIGLAGNDTIVGGKGYDLLDGGDGNDTLDARDGVAGDEVRCGDGRDTVRADRGDKIADDCEVR
jgi:hypothetical protein